MNWWILSSVLIVFSIVNILIGRKWFLSVVTYIKPTFEGVDGKASAKMWTAFWWNVLITIIIGNILGYVWYGLTREEAFTDNEIKVGYLLLDVTIAIGLAVLLIYGVVTANNLISLKTGLPNISSSIKDTIHEETHTAIKTPAEEETKDT